MQQIQSPLKVVASGDEELRSGGAVDEHLAAEQLRSRLTNRVNCIDEHASFRDSFTLKALRHVIKSERRDEADKMKTCT